MLDFTPVRRQVLTMNEFAASLGVADDIYAAPTDRAIAQRVLEIGGTQDHHRTHGCAAA